MKNKILLLILILIISIFMLTGCKEGDEQNKYPDGLVKYDMFLNSGSRFVYTFQDPETKVWYISTSKGVTPRLNADGSLYVKE